MSVTLSLFAGVGAQFLDNNGVILSGGKIYTYAAGTTTPLATYTSNLGNNAHPNPIILDSAGRIPGGELWLTTGYGYKFVTQDANNVLIGTYDNVPSSTQPPIINDASSVSYEQGYTVNAGSFVIGYTYLITFVGSTNFQLIGAAANTVGTLFTATGAGSGTGTAKLSRTVQARLQDSVSVKDFGALGDGITNDTAAIQAAINSVGSRGTVNFPSGTYLLTSGVTIPSSTFVNLIGDNAVLLAGANNITMVTHAGNIVRNGTHLFQGLEFKGNSYTGVTGFDANTLLKALWENCFFTGCNIGLNVNHSMESNVINCGTYLNTIGIQIASDATNGGGNGNTYVGNTLQQDDIGYLIYNFGSYPLENNIIVGGVIQGSGYCGIAAIGGDVSVSGTHFEAMGLGANSSTTIYGTTIPKACIYSKNSWASISDLTNGDANGYPQLLLSNSKGTVKNINGFGLAANNIFTGDITSTIEYLGAHNSTGKTNVWLNSWPTALYKDVPYWTFMGEPKTVINNTLPNIYTASNPQIPLLDNPLGCTVNGTVADDQLGYASSVSYLASVGSTGANRITIAAFPSTIAIGSYYIVSLLAKASVNTTLGFALDNSLNANTFQLGNQWTRVVLAFTSYQNVAGGSNMYIYPTTTEGATVEFARIHSYSSTTWPEFNSISGQILEGHWNPNKWNQLNYSAAPTTGTWKLGDIVYNTSPASAGYVGWVCTAAGTPGTWKTFGLIS